MFLITLVLSCLFFFSFAFEKLICWCYDNAQLCAYVGVLLFFLYILDYFFFL